MEKTVGYKIKLERAKKGLNQKKLAALIGVSHTTISNWETNYASPKQNDLRKLASIFGVSTDYLLGLSEENFESLKMGYEARKSIPVISSLKNSVSTKTVANVSEYIEVPAKLLGEGSFFATEVLVMRVLELLSSMKIAFKGASQL